MHRDRDRALRCIKPSTVRSRDDGLQPLERKRVWMMLERIVAAMIWVKDLVGDDR
jgi:hypothetical protein